MADSMALHPVLGPSESLPSLHRLQLSHTNQSFLELSPSFRESRLPPTQPHHHSLLLL